MSSVSSAHDIHKTVDVNPVVEPLAFLLGTWRGNGKGIYPTIDDFEFGEELTFWHAGGGWIAHVQKTNSGDDGRPDMTAVEAASRAIGIGFARACAEREKSPWRSPIGRPFSRLEVRVTGWRTDFRADTS